MRKRTDEINVRVYPTEKKLIRRKAKKCGMTMSAYLRSLGTDAAVKAAPNEDLMLAYQKVLKLHADIRFDVVMTYYSDALTEIEELLLKAYHGEEDADGSHENMGNS
jgi:hypothetical protein